MRLKTCLASTGIRLIRGGIGSLCVSLTTALLLLLMGGCALPTSLPATDESDVPGDEVDDQVSPETIPPRDPRECPALDSQLFDLTQVDDPAQLAEELGFRVRDGKVQVLLVLTSEDTGFLEEYGVELGTQSGCQVQAFVPFDQLCELAKTDPVLAVRPAAQAFPQ
ncbi:MAG: hypothetical protein R6X31_09815 [Anaerolineae bacterium]